MQICWNSVRRKISPRQSRICRKLARKFRQLAPTWAKVFNLYVASLLRDTCLYYTFWLSPVRIIIWWSDEFFKFISILASQIKSARLLFYLYRFRYNSNNNSTKRQFLKYHIFRENCFQIVKIPDKLNEIIFLKIKLISILYTKIGYLFSLNRGILVWRCCVIKIDRILSRMKWIRRISTTQKIW